MHFRTILLTACLFLAALMQAGCDSTPEKEKYRVGIINPSSGLNEVVKGFKLGMAERGYKEGENLTYIECGPIKLNEVAAAAKKMIKQDIDLLYTTTTHGTKTAKETLAGTDIPIVFAPMFSPEKSGVVSSLLKPDGNITGVKVGGSSANTFFWLMSILPNTKHIFIPFHCTDPAASMCFVDVSLAARKAGVTIEGIDITNQKELEAALDRIPSKTDAIWLSCSPLIFSNIDKIVSAAKARKIPVASTTRQQEKGVMVSYGFNNITLGKQASRIADLVLQGTPPSNIPIETSEFFLSINLTIADELGITIPEHILRQADAIIR